jgi:hypothetical protein
MMNNALPDGRATAPLMITHAPLTDPPRITRTSDDRGGSATVRERVDPYF